MIYRAQRLLHRYNGRVALEVHDLAVPQGSRFAVVGPNGCGKTTLMEIFVGLMAPSEGELFFYDRPLRLPLSRELRSRVAYVAQQPFALPGLVVENVMLAIGRGRTRAHSRRLALGWLERFGIETLADRLERTLSVGQLRIAALARAAAREAQLLVLDEPFAFVDELFEGVVRDVLDCHHRAGGTIVMTNPRRSALASWATDMIDLGATNAPSSLHARPEQLGWRPADDDTEIRAAAG